ncbi:Ca2+-transporting ATPase [Clostridium collagenovorans DSM 3089]|uniref:Ca2+-transporting ATPase n=1 Tax=Clostridium collagenovorans DSM 3089 TaxID=1121306 RepID=A0A1M5U5R8_9CLOT|nr:cation-translocating P-type ATPase [Clostridium collagenovorans]SHH58053.1 Ca2+-transporting ATPase [Clostridium collagenovorans DSM 3089]
MKNAYARSKEELFKDLNVTSSGLTQKEVQERHTKYGLNELTEGKKKSIAQVFLEQFKDMLVIILMIAAIVSMFLDNVESALVIFVVITLNAILGTVQHVKAEQSLNSLKALASPMAKVLRDNKKLEIPSKEVVVGDILFLEAGDFVSADGRIIENFSLGVNESSLTGESESILKTSDVIEKENIPVGDRTNMAFSGSLVTSGRATMLVTNIGMDTELGKVADLLNNTKEKKTPLQVNLDKFGKNLAIIILAICALVFVVNISRGQALIDSFMFAVALAVAAIPEALSSIVTIVLSLGTQKMAKENAIIRKLAAVEGLGSVSIICSDKTGTLTQNKMTVQKLYVDNRVLNSNELDLNNSLENDLLSMGLLCSDAVTTDGKEIGDPTEVALVNLGGLYNIDELDIRKDHPRLNELPFDSDRKLMSVVYNSNNKNIMVTKGAVDVLLNRTVNIETSKGIRKISKDDINKIENINKDFSKTGLRVLAFAYKNIDNADTLSLEDETDFTFLGLISMMDPPRVESAQAVEQCIKAGIKPIMITGDHKITAAAIAKQIGILKNEEEAVEGAFLDNFNDEELKDVVENYSVYARVSPEHKIRIVRAWQEKGNVVAMTGDGVNDAPALKQADIGVAMGITGSEVAKDASSMILTDDNFATIVKSVSNGRNIYTNIKNSIKFLLSGNTAGILSVLYASLLALPVPFAAVHLLFINLLTDSLPAIALGMEPHNNNVMKEKPRKMNASILSKDFIIEIFFEGLVIAACTMAAFHIGINAGGELLGSTMAFATLCLSRLVHGFNSKAKSHVLSKKALFSNKYLWGAFGLGFLLLNLVLLVSPLQSIFEVAPLSSVQLMTIYGLSFVPFVVIQGAKLIISKLPSKVEEPVEDEEPVKESIAS